MRSRTIEFIVYTVFTLVVISTLISIFNNNIFEDGARVKAQWLGQDIVSLLVAAPVLLLAQYKCSTMYSWQWKLVLSGILFYYVYTYTFYIFGTELTWLYLFHLPIFSLSLMGLFIALYDLFNLEFSIRSRPNLIKPIIISYLTLLSFLLATLWISDVISHLMSADYVLDTPTGEAPIIIYSLDLGVVIPLMILGSIGYWKQKQYGIILTGLMLVKSSTLGFALMSMGASLYFHNLEQSVGWTVMWCIIGCVGTILTILFFKNNRLVMPKILLKNNISIELMEYRAN